MNESLETLLTRRSVKASDLYASGPDAAQLETLLTAAARVPDHGRMVPFRFVVFEGAAREAMGVAVRDAFVRDHPKAGADKIALEAGRFTRAPLVIAVISRIRKGKHPQWEQVLSAGAVCQTMLLAAKSMGFGAQWLTEWYAYDQDVRAALGCDKRENIAGFIHIGTAPDISPEERERPDLSEIVTRFGEDARRGDARYDREKFGIPRAGFESA